MPSAGLRFLDVSILKNLRRYFLVLTKRLTGYLLSRCLVSAQPFLTLQDQDLLATRNKSHDREPTTNGVHEKGSYSNGGEIAMNSLSREGASPPANGWPITVLQRPNPDEEPELMQR